MLTGIVVRHLQGIVRSLVKIERGMITMHCGYTTAKWRIIKCKAPQGFETFRDNKHSIYNDSGRVFGIRHSCRHYEA